MSAAWFRPFFTDCRLCQAVRNKVQTEQMMIPSATVLAKRSVMQKGSALGMVPKHCLMQFHSGSSKR